MLLAPRFLLPLLDNAKNLPWEKMVKQQWIIPGVIFCCEAVLGMLYRAVSCDCPSIF